jgi:hypothetical protein
VALTDAGAGAGLDQIGGRQLGRLDVYRQRSRRILGCSGPAGGLVGLELGINFSQPAAGGRKFPRGKLIPVGQLRGADLRRDLERELFPYRFYGPLEFPRCSLGSANGPILLDRASAIQDRLEPAVIRDLPAVVTQIRGDDSRADGKFDYGEDHGFFPRSGETGSIEFEETPMPFPNTSAQFKPGGAAGPGRPPGRVIDYAIGALQEFRKQLRPEDVQQLRDLVASIDPNQKGSRRRRSGSTDRRSENGAG